MTEFPRPDSIQEAKGFLRDVDGAERGQLLKSFLWQALSQRDWMLAAFVMEHDRTLVSRDASVYGPLYDALSLLGDCSDVIAWLLERGADLEQRSHNNWTPLIAAAAGNMHESARVLLDAGADIEASTIIDEDSTALMEASRHGHLVMVWLLREAGADTLRRSNVGQTAAQIARKHGHSEVAEFLDRREQADTQAR